MVNREVNSFLIFFFTAIMLLGGISHLAWSKADLPEPKGTFIIGTNSYFSNIDPNKTNPGSPTVQAFQSLILPSLIDYHILPDLAVTWEVIDPKTWKFIIRKGVKFNNGQPLTSADIQYSFYRQMGKFNRKFPGANKRLWQKIIDHIDTPDDYTAVIHTKYADPSLLSIIRWVFIVPKTYIETVGDSKFSKMPVGTGPFMYTDRKIGESLTLEANPHYWNINPEKGSRGPARIKKVILRSMPKEQTRMAAMKAGEIDGTGIGPDSIKSFENDQNFTVYYSRKNQAYFVMFNWRDEKDPKKGEPNPFTDIRVRRALNHAVDVDSLIRNYLTGREYRTTLLGRDGIGYNPDVPFYSYDREKAKKLLAEAGYSKGFSTEFYTTTDAPAFYNALVQYLRDVGLKVEIKQTTLAVLMTRMIRKKLYGMLIWGGGLGGPDPAATFFKTCVRYDGNWAIHGKDERVEELVRKQMQEFNVEKRAKIIDEVIQILWKDAWFIPLYEPVFVKVVNNKWNYANAPTSASFNLPDISLK
ncbi:MAG: ABC transporter substrate-binding protein [Deltaproteobacteria bacterium]|nr:ABC transporter substrate-binding protein [Deltaproteobacteria bacterium]